MSSAPEPSAPVAMPGPAPNPVAPSPRVPVALPQPVPELLPTPVPAPEVTPSPMPTAGVWELQGSGKPVASVEIIGHPVHQPIAQQLGSLRTHHPPVYDFAGNDLHNSNSAMVSSVAYAGRPDIAAKLMRDLEPPDRMASLEHDEHLSREGAAMRIALERAGREPSAPGASHELTREQIEGRATPEPPRILNDESKAQVTAVGESVLSTARSALAAGRRPPDMLDAGPGRDGKYFTVMRTEGNGTQHLERKSEPFQQSGPIFSADADRITQSIRGRETLTYNTSDLLQSSSDPEAALQILQRAAANHESANIRMGLSSLTLDAQGIAQSKNQELGR